MKSGYFLSFGVIKTIGTSTSKPTKEGNLVTGSTYLRQHVIEHNRRSVGKLLSAVATNQGVLSTHTNTADVAICHELRAGRL